MVIPKPQKIRYPYILMNYMKLCFKLSTLAFFVNIFTGNAQQLPANNTGYLTYNISLSDYTAAKKSNSKSFGIGLSYWKALTPTINFSGTLTGTFSNFPKLFVKNDSVGQAGFTTQMDALAHANFFKKDVRINPFLTGGLGAGIFYGHFAAYAPLGAGLQIHFKEGALFMLQAQYRLALTNGITNDYLFYSAGIVQQGIFNKNKKKADVKPIPVPPVAEVEKDTDGDGVPDSKDSCITVKGTLNGCPDTDGDGIADKDDKCPTVAGLAKYNGCPIPDTDGDGINDEEDKCPTVFGVKENNGCPWPDADGDGVPDKDDKCPTVAGKAEYAGCPLPLVDSMAPYKATADSMYYNVNFEYAKEILTTEAVKILQGTIDLLKADNTLHVVIAGHTDSAGSNNFNMQLSAKRAQMVKKYLVSAGVDAKKIITTFYGSKKPLDIIDQSRNRRAEIILYKTAINNN